MASRRRGVKKITKWQCEWCGKIYDTKRQANTCAARGFPDVKFKVGDIVKFYPRFGWKDGDSDWIAEFETEKRDMLSFYYVIVDIRPDECDPHRPTYFVITDAMTGKNGYRGGRTYPCGHITPRRVNKRKIPKKVKERAKEIVESGEIIDYLL